MTIRTVQRFDAPGKIRVVKSPEGFLLTTGKIAKAGIMSYRQADGTTIRELVTEEVLKHEGSNASLFGKAFTLEHPSIDVTPDNWTNLSHGTWGGAVYETKHVDGPGLYAPVVVHTRYMLDILQQDDGPKELSPGYSVKVDDTGGVHPTFGQFDTAQIPGTREYNHGALTVIARGGPDLTIRKDSAFEVVNMPLDKTKTTEKKTKEVEPTNESKFDNFMKEVKDGFDALGQRMSALEEKKKAPTKEKLKEEPPKAEGKNDSAANRLAWFKSRQELEEVAGRYSVKADSLDDAALKAAIVKAAQPESTRTDSVYVDVAYDMIKVGGLGSAKSRYDGFGSAIVDSGLNSSRRTDNDDEPYAPTNDFFKGASGKN